MENTSVMPLPPAVPHDPAWETVDQYQPYIIGSIFILNSLLSLGYLIYLLRYRSYNHLGGLISGLLLLAFLFSASRSLLVAQAFVELIRVQIIPNLDFTRIVSICSIFGLAFTAVVRSAEPEFSRSYILTKLACFMCVLASYALAALPMILLQFYDEHQLIPKAVQVACDVYFMTLLFILGIAYILILPKTISMGREGKSSMTSPHRIVYSALVGLLAAVLLLGYVMFLLAGFITERLQFGWDHNGRFWQDWGGVFKNVHHVGIGVIEAILTFLLVLTAGLLIKVPVLDEGSFEGSPGSSAGAPEMQGLLYPGRNPPSAPAYSHHSGRNGYQPIALHK